jgi:hypothetical protein
MRRKLPLVLTLTAWLLATGSHWDLVQTFAWGQMIAGYSRTMPVVQAVRLTFTPDNMCGVCRAVADAKQQADADHAAIPGGKLDGKVLLACMRPADVIVGAPAVTFRSLSDPAIPAAHRAAPPVPPPRCAAA